MAKLTTVILIEIDTDTNENIGIVSTHATFPGKPQEFQNTTVKCDGELFKNIETAVTEHAKKYGSTFGG